MLQRNTPSQTGSTRTGTQIEQERGLFGSIGRAWSRLSIQVKLILPQVLAILIAFLLIITIVYPTINRFIEQGARDNFVTRTDDIARGLTDLIEEARHQIEPLDSDVLEDFYRALQGESDVDVSYVIDATSAVILDRINTATLPIAEFRILDSSGAELIVVEGPRGENGSPVFRPSTAMSQGMTAIWRQLGTLAEGSFLYNVQTRQVGDEAGRRTEIVLETGSPLYYRGRVVGGLSATYFIGDSLLGAYTSLTADEYQFSFTVLDENRRTLLNAINQNGTLKTTVLGQPDHTNLRLTNDQLTTLAQQSTDQQIYGTYRDVQYRIVNLGGYLPSDTIGADWSIVVSKLVSDPVTSQNLLDRVFIGVRVFLLGLIVAAIASLIATRITRPLRRAGEFARRLGQGDLTAKIPITSGDEIGQLAEALNVMRAQLTDFVSTLEMRVQDRTRDLEIAAEISRDASSSRRIDELLQRTVESIRDRFSFYHAQVFLLDDVRQFAVLVTSTGEAGRMLLARNHKLAVGSDSIVGQVTEKGRAFITLDTEKSEVPHRFNPLLPETRSEMALPMRSGNEVIGALDIQSIQSNAFTETDAKVFQVLADQIAIAVVNARLLQESTDRLSQIDNLNRRLTGTVWKEFNDQTATPQEVRYDLLNVEKSNEKSDEKIDTASAVTTPSDGVDQPTSTPTPRETMDTAIRVRGETIGQLMVEADTPLSPDDQLLIQSVAERVALALENARLSERTQTALTEVERLYNATRAFTTTSNVTDIYKFAVEQFSSYDFVTNVLFLVFAPDVDRATFTQYEVTYAWSRTGSPVIQGLPGQTISRDSLPAYWVEDGDQPNFNAKVVDIERARELTPQFAALAPDTRGGMRFPLYSRDTQFGLALIYSDTISEFPDTFIRFVTSLTDQMTTAIANRYLITATEENRQTLETVLSSLPTGVLVTGAKGEIILSNAQARRLLGLDRVQAYSRIRTTTEEPITDENFAPMRAVRTGKPVISEDVTVTDEYGVQTDMIVNAVPIFSAENSTVRLAGSPVISAVTVLQDITEMRDLQSVLESSLRDTTTLYELMRFVAAENDLIQILGAVASQLRSIGDPRELYFVFRNEDESLDTYAVDYSGVPQNIDVDTKLPVRQVSTALPAAFLDESADTLVEDVDADEQYRSDPLLTALDIRAFASLSLRARGRRIGWMILTFRQPHNISPEQKRFLTTAADQTAVAADNARLSDQTTNALYEATNLYNATYNLTRAESIEEVLMTARDLVKQYKPDKVDVLLLESIPLVGNKVNWVMHYERNDPYQPGFVELEQPPHFDEWELVEGEASFIEDSLANPDALPQLPGDVGQAVAIGSVPLSIKGRVTGRIVVRYDQPHVFTRAERQLLNTVADQVAIVIDNASLVNQTQQSLQETATLYQSTRSITNAGTTADILNSVIEHAAPPQLARAMIMELIGDSWDDSEATVEVVSSMTSLDDKTFNDTMIGRRMNSEILSIWPQIASNVPVWIEDLENLGRGSGRRGSVDDLDVGDDISIADDTDDLDQFGDSENPFLSEADFEFESDMGGDGAVYMPTELPQEMRTFYETLQMRGVLIMPLRAAGRPVGAMLIGTQEPWLFDERQLRIYQTLTDQAAITIQSRRLLAEAQRRALQLQTTAQVSKAATSILDLSELFNQTVNLVKDSFNYDHVQIFLVSPDETDAVLVASTGEAGRQLLANKHHLLVGSQSIIGQVTATRQPRIAVDTQDSRSVHRPNPLLPKTRSELALPLVARNRILGALDVQSNLPGTFTKEDEQILANLADQIAVAINNAQLFESSKRRGDEMRFLFDATKAATGLSVEKDAALYRLATLIRETVGADATMVALIEDENTLRSYAAVAPDSAVSLSASYDLNHPFFKWLLENRRSAILNDVIRTSRQTLPGITELFPGVGSGVFIPLYAGNQIAGIIGTMRAERSTFTAETEQLLETLSPTLAAILQNASLVNELTQANTRLREVDKLKSQFLANMSHELRTPLNSIIGFSRVILKGIDGPLTDLQQQDLGTIHESGKHLLGLVNDILDQAKIEAGKMELSNSHFSVAELVKGVMSTAVGLVKDRSVRLRQEVEETLPEAWGDEFRTRQVLLNLVSNAAKFTPEGSVTVSAFEVDENDRRYIQISVTDTGIGIPEDKLSSVFESFQQVENTTARQYEGTGLGLPIAKSLVEMQHGRIWAESQLGRGSTFSFTVPIEEIESDTLPELPAEPEFNPTVETGRFRVSDILQTQTGTFKIPADLLDKTSGDSRENGNGTGKGISRIIIAVDDQISAINLYRRYLQREGYELVSARPEDVEELAIAYQPRLILLDINMPNRNGWDVLSALKDRDQTYHIPVIVITVDSDRERAFRLDAADFLNKPVNEQQLIETVKRIDAEQNRKKILIVDDQPESIRFVREALAADGRFNVVEAVGGTRGMEMLQSHHPDLIILDLRMPEIDGFMVLSAIRGEPDTANIPVLVVTADDLNEDEIARLQSYSAVRYQKQTLDPMHLLTQVASQLG